MRKQFITLAAFGLVLGLITGCSTDHKTQRSLMTVDQVNGGSPVISDVLENSAIVADLILFRFSNRPANSITNIQAGTPYFDYIIDRYEIAWVRPDGGPVPPTTNDLTNIRVESGEIASAYIRLVSYSTKANPILQNLVASPTIINMIAAITFYGHESGSDKETSFQTSVSVEFLDLND